MASNYPPVNYRFSVEVPDISSTLDSSFHEVTGLKAKIVTEPLREGGNNNFIFQMPIGTEWENLVLKRGVVRSSELIDWVRDAIDSFIFTPMPIIVKLLGDNSEILISWTFLNAIPLGMEISSFDAQSKGGPGDILVETLTFSHHGCQREDH